MQKIASYVSGMQRNLLDKLISAASISDLNEQISAQKKVVEATEQAVRDAEYNHLMCMVFYLTESITGLCGHTYTRLSEDSHAWVYFDCGHAGWKCQPGIHIHYITHCQECFKAYYFCEAHEHNSGSCWPGSQ